MSAEGHPRDREIERALHSLPGDQHRLLRLVYFHGVDQRDVVDYLRISPRVVSQTVAAGLAGISRFLEAERAAS